jgi:extracellular matrix regulatory protein A
MDQRMINVGFGNSVVASRILAVVKPKSSPIKKLKEEAKEQKKLIDVTEGRKTRSIIILDSNHVILSAVQPETITQRFTPAIQRDQSSLDEDPL